MNKYLVEIESPEVRDRLTTSINEKVGIPLSSPNVLIIETDSSLEVISAIDGVLLVEEDLTEDQSDIDQPDAPESLAWISNSGGNYSNEKSGAGVDIYVLDEGVRGTHGELDGRVMDLYSFDHQSYSVSDTHGTLVSGCAAGTTYGTAKEATIVNCRMNWTRSEIIKALDTILYDHLFKPDNRQSILNFSGSSTSVIIGRMFERLTKYGVVIVAAAGNDSEPVPRYPAKNAWVVAVGSINRQEKPAWFTNFGCDVFAPGQDIQSASVFSDTAIANTSGTSFSAPYYAGLLACLLEGSDKFNTAEQVSEFTHKARNQLMETGRIEDFHNDNLLVRTVTTNGIGGIYYPNASLTYSDHVIGDQLTAMLPNMQEIADACRKHNISLSRLSSIGTIHIDEINQLFIDNNVRPWWFT